MIPGLALSITQLAFV